MGAGEGDSMEGGIRPGTGGLDLEGLVGGISLQGMAWHGMDEDMGRGTACMDKWQGQRGMAFESTWKLLYQVNKLRGERFSDELAGLVR